MDFFFKSNPRSRANSTEKLPGGELHRANAVSQTAYVTSPVLPGTGGRLHYLSTEWGARSIDNSFIAEGTLVRPVARRGNTWLVAVAEPMPSHQAA
jgi:hypothetical protein